MTAQFILLPDAVVTVKLDSKSAVLDLLANLFASTYGLEKDVVLARLTEREQLGSTGFGRGVAIPHARVADVERPVAVFLRLQTPVGFDAADDMPVSLVFGLLSPEQAGVVHLHALAAISRMMRDDTMRAALAQASEAEAMFGLLSNVIDRDAA